MFTSDFWVGKTVLITGATGLIGSNLIDRLLKARCERIIAVGRSESKLRAVFGKYAGEGRLVLLEHDVAKPLPQDLGCVDWIFHAASPVSGSTIRTAPASVVQSNLQGAINCLDYLRTQKDTKGESGAFVVFSSATVYGHAGREDVCRSESETVACEQLDSQTAPYSESKRMTEVLALAYGRQWGVDVRIVRFSFVFGPCPVLPKTAFYEFVGKALGGEDLVFLNAGFGRRDNIYVDDAIDGLLLVCERGETCKAYNISSNGELGNFAAIDEMASVIARLANEASNVNIHVVLPLAESRTGGVLLDNSRIKTLGWTVRTSLEEGIRRTFLAAWSAGNREKA